MSESKTDADEKIPADEAVRLRDREEDRLALDSLQEVINAFLPAIGYRSAEGFGSEKYDDSASALVLAARDRMLLAAMAAIERYADDQFPANAEVNHDAED